MKAIIYGGIAGALALAAWTWACVEYGKNLCQAKVVVTTITEESRQVKEAASIAVGDVKHEAKLEAVKQKTRAAAAPLDCDRVDIGDLRVDALGGVRH